MIVHPDPASPLWVQAAADLALVLHIGGGSVGLVSGAVALVARKGGRLHRTAGNTFVVSMLIMSAVGAMAAPLLPQRSSVVPGLLTFYLTATAWAAVRRRDGQTGVFEEGAFLFALAAVAMGLTFGWEAATSARGLLDGDPPTAFFVFASLTALAAALDLRMILQGGVFGAHRIARHVWRMGLALLIATASFFEGQQRVMPKVIQGSPWLHLPAIAVLALTMFWLIRTLAVRRRATAPSFHESPTPG